MDLVIPTPEFELKLPISKQTVKYRPFLVKEERVMLVLKESTDSNMVLNNLKKIMNQCILSELDIDKLTYSDFEYLFLNMRVRSMGESVDFNTTCPSCGKSLPIEIDLNDLCEDMEKKEIPDPKLMLTEDIGVMVTPLKLKDAAAANVVAEKTPVQSVMFFIEKVFTKETVYSFDEVSPKDKVTFIDSLTAKHVDMIMERISEFPKLEAIVPMKCFHCEHEFEFKAEGLETFFT